MARMEAFSWWSLYAPEVRSSETTSSIWSKLSTTSMATGDSSMSLRLTALRVPARGRLRFEDSPVTNGSLWSDKCERKCLGSSDAIISRLTPRNPQNGSCCFDLKSRMGLICHPFMMQESSVPFSFGFGAGLRVFYLAGPNFDWVDRPLCEQKKNC